jgi:hypothetical protein
VSFGKDLGGSGKENGSIVVAGLVWNYSQHIGSASDISECFANDRRQLVVGEIGISRSASDDMM